LTARSTSKGIVQNWEEFMASARRFLAFLAAVLPLMLSGCFELDTRIKLNPDGSATITEKLRFSQQLLDLGSKESGELRIAELLTREAVQERMKQMGKGVRLVSHEVRDVENGARESLAVFQVDDINDYQYASPFLAYVDYRENCLIRCQMVPLLKSRNYAGTAGEMAMAFRPLKPPVSEIRLKEGTPPPRGPSPRELQALRQVLPVFADLLRGFKVRLTFESYAPITITGFGWRDRRTGTSIVDLLHVTDRDLDWHGVKFLENEEIVLDLLRGRLGSLNIAETVRHFQDNHTVPLFLPWGSANAPWRQSDEICFRPSKQLFDRHMAGKMLDFDRWQSTGKNIRPAKFEEVGWLPKK
jgi:hypothetical protein